MKKNHPIIMYSVYSNNDVQIKEELAATCQSYGYGIMLKDDTDKAIGPEVIPMIASTHRMQWEEAQNCHVILYPEGMVKLNPSSAEILKHCDGQKTVKAIIEELQQQFPDADLEQDILNFLEVAHGNGWIRTK